MRISFYLFFPWNSSSYFPTELLDVARLYFPSVISVGISSLFNSTRYAKAKEEEEEEK